MTGIKAILEMFATVIGWAIKGLLACIGIGILILILIVAREVAYTVAYKNRKRMEEKDKDAGGSV